MLYARNPGGAPANVAVAASRLGAHTAFIGKAGKDMHGKFLKSVLEKESVDTKGMLLDENYFTTLAFVEVSETGERTFSFARKPGADTKIQKEEWMWMCWIIPIFSCWIPVPDGSACKRYHVLCGKKSKKQGQRDFLRSQLPCISVAG